MNTAKWFGTGAASLFLFGSAMIGLLGGSLTYSLYAGLAVVLAVAVLFLALALPVVIWVWLISIIAPKGESCGSLLEAILLRGMAIQEQRKNRQDG